jgi:hypothetical protein
MEPVHELVASEADTARPHLVLVQEKQQVAEVIMVRCPSCKGLRGVMSRHVTRNSQVCGDCRKGHVVERTQFHNYWLERFTREEIAEMGRAIWG